MNDYLQPVMSKHPDTIVIEFDNGLCNINEAIIKLMIREENEWEDRYKNINIFKDILKTQPEELYYITRLFTLDNLLRDMAKENMPDSKFLEDKETLCDRMNLVQDCSLTVLLSGIFALLRTGRGELLQKIYIVNPTFNKPRFEYMNYLFPNLVNDKVIALDNTIEEVLETIPTITTAIVKSTDYLFEKILPNDKIDKDRKTFMILGKAKNENTDEGIKEKELIEKYSNDYNCNIYFLVNRLV